MRHLLMVLSSFALVCVFALPFAHAQTEPGVPTPSATGQDAKVEAKTVKPPDAASSQRDSAPAQDIVPAVVSAILRARKKQSRCASCALKSRLSSTAS